MSSPPAAGERDIANRFYDHGCELIFESAGLREAAANLGAGAAAPAVISCVEAALRELALAVTALERTTAAVAELGSSGDHERDQRRRVRMHQGLSNLERALGDAADAAAAARRLTARALDAAV